MEVDYFKGANSANIIIVRLFLKQTDCREEVTHHGRNWNGSREEKGFAFNYKQVS